MYRKIIPVWILWCLSNSVLAHEWTPTYPKLNPSYVSGISYAKMELYNNRKDVNYYEVTVHDSDWNPVAFALSGNKIIQIRHLERKTIDVYIRDKDKDKVTYICTRSKMITDATKETFLSSRICSKIK